MPNKAFFLDRDGTINVDYDFVHKPEQWDFCEGAIDFIRRLNKSGYKVIVVTNQSGIARGLFSMNEVLTLHNWVDSKLAEYDARVDGWYIAPWHPDFHEGRNPELLKLRKPDNGLFLQAAQEHDVDFVQSFMAGDKISDVKPALIVDMRPFMVRSRFVEKWDHDWIARHNIQVFENLGELGAFFFTEQDNS